METKKTAIGSVFAIAGKIIVLTCGFGLHIFLARWMKPDLYGLYGFIMSILIWVEYMVLMGVPSAYRKIISENENMIDSVLQSIKWLFIPYCLTITFIFILISLKIFSDTSLVLLLVISAIDIPIYGIYAAYLSLLNGYRDFIRESVSSSLYAVFKISFVILLVFMGFGLKGAFIGNAIASFAGFLVVFFFVKKRISQHKINKIIDLKPRIVSFGLPYLLYILTAMLIVHMDMWFVKGLMNDDMMTGYYSVSYNLSRPILFLLTGLIFVMFPSMSKAISENNEELIKKHIFQIMRFATIILIPFTLIISSKSGEIITLLFGAGYLPASNSLKILLIGISFFSIYSVFLNIIAAENKPYYSFFISLSLIPIAMVMNYTLINSYGIDGAAMATASVSFLGLIVAGIYIWNRFRIIINLPTLIRVVSASACLYIIARQINSSGYYLILELVILSFIYITLLILFKEINSGDLAIIRENIFKRK